MIRSSSKEYFLTVENFFYQNIFTTTIQSVANGHKMTLLCCKIRRNRYKSAFRFITDKSNFLATVLKTSTIFVALKKCTQGGENSTVHQNQQLLFSFAAELMEEYLAAELVEECTEETCNTGFSLKWIFVLLLQRRQKIHLLRTAMGTSK